SQVITRITYYLEEAMAPKLTMHAGLLDVYGVGVLLIGESGVGKSECALDLVSRGHRLIADDNVTIKRHPNDVLLGYTSEAIGHHMELRGIGIINIKDLFGVASTRDIKPIDLVVRLERWMEGAEYDRLGLGGETYECLGVSKPLVRLPVASGRNLALLVEIASRNHLIKMQGYHSADELARKLDERIAEQSRLMKEDFRPTRAPPLSGKDVMKHATNHKTKRHGKG
ncbi:MAG: HPr(Ser) kinase/phosphatase, partial [Thermoanaerobaculia bacterium]|nr:HPr(Ser) kinase/phosphatase [Thermoanaerobaculia bacterium]